MILFVQPNPGILFVRAGLWWWLKEIVRRSSTFTRTVALESRIGE